MSVGTPCPQHPQKAIVGACDRCGDFGCIVCIPTGRSCLKCQPNFEATKPDVGKSLTWVLNDPDIRAKVAAGALCTLGAMFSILFLLIPLFMLMGYHMRIARLVREGQQSGLPGWEGWGSLAWDGFKSYVASFLPMLFAYAFLGVVIGVTVVATLPAKGSPGSQPPPAFMVAMFGSILAFYGFIFVYMAFIPAVQVEYLRTGSVLSAFHMKSIYRTIRLNPMDYFMFLVISIVLYMLSALVGELLCFVGLFATLPLGLFVHGHYLGQHVAWLDAQQPME